MAKRVTFTANQVKSIIDNVSIITERNLLASQLGYMFGTTRNIYDALGWPKTLTYTDYKNRYDRQDIAKAIIDAPVLESWSEWPKITDESEQTDESPFESRIAQLNESLGLLDIFQQVDRLASLGEYAVLLLGFNDPGLLDQPVTKASELLYVTAYSEEDAAIKSWEMDSKSPRFGLPLTYSIRTGIASNDGQTTTLTVHYSRIIHVAEDRLGNKVKGIPKLKSVYNRLLGLEIICGTSPEIWWRGARPKLVAEAKEETGSLTDDEKTALSEKIEDFDHGYKSWLLAGGLNVKELLPQIADPKPHVDTQIAMIAAAVRMPVRILLGSERGQLSSDQDERAWAKQIRQRREQHCTSNILRPFIDATVNVGVLEAPVGSYSCDWDDPLAPSEKEQADVLAIRSQAVATYCNGASAEEYPPDMFFEKEMGFTPEELERRQTLIGERDEEVNNDLDEPELPNGTEDILP